MSRIINPQRGVVLITSLLFLLMLTTIAITLVNQGNRAPKLVANAELKAITFNESQTTLGDVVALGMEGFVSKCGLTSSYNPTATGKTCVPYNNNSQPNPSIAYRATSNVVPRSPAASGVGNYSVEYYRVEATSSQGDVSSSLAINSYKVMLSILGDGSVGEQSVIISRE